MWYFWTFEGPKKSQKSDTSQAERVTGLTYARTFYGRTDTRTGIIFVRIPGAKFENSARASARN